MLLWLIVIPRQRGNAFRLAGAVAQLGGGHDGCSAPCGTGRFAERSVSRPANPGGGHYSGWIEVSWVRFSPAPQNKTSGDKNDYLSLYESF